MIPITPLLARFRLLSQAPVGAFTFLFVPSVTIIGKARVFGLQELFDIYVLSDPLREFNQRGRPLSVEGRSTLGVLNPRTESGDGDRFVQIINPELLLLGLTLILHELRKRCGDLLRSQDGYCRRQRVHLTDFLSNHLTSF